MKINTSLSLKTLLILLMASLFPKSIFAQGVDTVYVSSDFTVHMAFPHEVRYVDISGNAPIDAGAIDGYSSILYLKCCEEFSSSCALTVMLSSSEIRTYILCYKKDEITLFVDCRKSPEKETQKDPPTMEGILSMDKMYHHLGQIRGKVMILCDVIWRSDNQVFFRLELSNRSSFDFVYEEATFIVERRFSRKHKRAVESSIPLERTNSLGTLSTRSGEKKSAVFCFDSFPIRTDERLVIYIHSKSMEDLRIIISEKDLR